MSGEPVGLGIALQMSDVVRQRVVDGKAYVASVRDARDVVDLARTLEPSFSRLWLTDNLGYVNTTALLGALAASTSSLDLGTFTAFPYGRSPIDTATALATVRSLMPGRDLAFGVSRGGGAATALYHSDRPLRLLREYVTTLRALLAGQTVETDQTPELVRTHGLRPGSHVSVNIEPADVPLLITSTGRRGLRLAGEIGDGVQFVTQQPTQSAALLAEPDFPARSGLAELDAGREASASARPFRRVYGISVSVASDPQDAVNFARRQVAAIIATKRDDQLVDAGIDPQLGQRVRAAMTGGDGLAEASSWVSADVVTRLIATGTPDQVAEQVSASIERSRAWGFDEHFVCFPLGPDVKDAVDTIVREVLPALSTKPFQTSMTTTQRRSAR